MATEETSPVGKIGKDKNTEGFEPASQPRLLESLLGN
jgi:hypothetical protein